MNLTDPNEVDALQAAHNLHLKLPGKDVAYWVHFLANNRRRDRASRNPIPFKRVGRSTLYHVNDLAAFAAKERTRREAAKAKRSTPLRGPIATASAQWSVGEGTRSHAGGTVVLRANGIVLSFELDPAQARALAEQLLAHADTAGQE